MAASAPAAAELSRDPAFWINAYNELLLAEMAANPRSGSLIRHRGLFSEATTEVGGLHFTLNDIEHGVLRRNSRPPYALRRLFGRGDERLAAMPETLDPRIHFALNCGARSCPPIRTYSPDTVDAELEQATVAYIRAETEIDRDAGTVLLPGVMKLYKGDFGGRRGALNFALPRLEPADREWIETRDSTPRIRFTRFDWAIVSP